LAHSSPAGCSPRRGTAGETVASGSQTPLRGYLVTGLVLAAVTAALPLLAWGVQIDGPGMQAWAWLDAFWQLGTFALLAIAGRADHPLWFGGAGVALDGVQ
jgi:hypothetical protein